MTRKPMPTKPAPACSNPHCPNLRPCPDHPIKDYKRTRPKTASRGYGGAWQRYRVIYLANNPVCSCGAMAKVVDHIQPVNQGGGFWDENNHQSMCKSCHNRKSAREMGQHV